MSYQLDFLLLKLRNAIADKEYLTMRANNDIAAYGQWQCNYDEGFAIHNNTINEIIEEINHEF